MLDPDTRILLTSALTPPAGLRLDGAIATTFSLDPAVLLEAPVHLAFLAARHSGDLDSLSLLEGVRRHAENISVYVQRGRMQIPRTVRPTPLFALLEEMIVEVASPRGGVFHPKVWAIRFVGPESDPTPRYRLLVLSRNMTADPSWDLCLRLDGNVTGQDREANAPLAHFFQRLPELTTGSIASAKKRQAATFARELKQVDWELPEGFEELRFHLPGEKGFDWQPPRTTGRMVAVSPFCSDATLLSVTRNAACRVLISRPETLADLKETTLRHFDRCLHLHEAAESDDGEECPKRATASGLHAKLCLWESRRTRAIHTHVLMGSANLTHAAFSRNVEILVELSGRQNRVGNLDAFLGPDGMGEFLVEFSPDTAAVVDAARQEAEACAERARTALAEADLALVCRATAQNDLWQLTLRGPIPPLEGITGAQVWPITVSDNHAANLPCGGVADLSLGSFSLSSLTGLIAFELHTAHPEVTVNLVRNLPMKGLPEERAAAILQTVIHDQGDFRRYLSLLLGDDVTAHASGDGTRPGDGLSLPAEGRDTPLLEELVRAFCRSPDTLKHIQKFVHDISRGKDTTIIPEDFLRLWRVFEKAGKARHV